MTCVGPCQPALSFQQLQQVWTGAGGSPSYAPLMAAIALAESGGVPNNTNPTDNGGKQTSWGLWQVSQGNHNPYPNWSDPTANAQVAINKLNTQGLTAWGTYNSGAAQRILAANGGGMNLPQIPGVGSNVGVGSTTQPTAGSGASDSDCLLKAPSASLAFFTLGGNCMLTRSAGRAVVGAVATVPAIVLAVLGVAWMTGVGGSASSLVKGLIPGGGLIAAPKAAEASSETTRQRNREKARERRERASEQDYRTAREAGARAAEREGAF